MTTKTTSLLAHVLHGVKGNYPPISYWGNPGVTNTNTSGMEQKENQAAVGS